MNKAVRTIGTVCLLLGVLAGLPAASAEEGKWQFRSRLIFIAPNDDADATLGALNTEVKSDFTVEIDGTYFVTPRFGIEGILATAAQEVTLTIQPGATTPPWERPPNPTNGPDGWTRSRCCTWLPRRPASRSRAGIRRCFSNPALSGTTATRARTGWPSA